MIWGDRASSGPQGRSGRSDIQVSGAWSRAVAWEHDLSEARGSRRQKPTTKPPEQRVILCWSELLKGQGWMSSGFRLQGCSAAQKVLISRPLPQLGSAHPLPGWLSWPSAAPGSQRSRETASPAQRRAEGADGQLHLSHWLTEGKGVLKGSAGWCHRKGEGCWAGEDDRCLLLGTLDTSKSSWVSPVSGGKRGGPGRSV